MPLDIRSTSHYCVSWQREYGTQAGHGIVCSVWLVSVLGQAIAHQHAGKQDGLLRALGSLLIGEGSSIFVVVYRADIPFTGRSNLPWPVGKSRPPPRRSHFRFWLRRTRKERAGR